MVTGQIALSFVEAQPLHGHITMWFSKGQPPFQCTIMAHDKSWHDTTGETLQEAVGAAIDLCGNEAIADAWAVALEAKS